MPERVLATALVAAGAVLAFGAPAAWLLEGGGFGRAPPPAEAAPAEAAPGPPPVAAVPDPAPAEARPPHPAAAPPREARAPAVEAAPARLADLEVAAPAAPVRLRVEALDVDAPVVGVGVDGDGAMRIPADVDTVGWYRFGPAPGAGAGSSVMTAHVDSHTQGPGVFFDLARIPEGAEVVVELEDGGSERYVTRALRRYDKRELPVAELFAEAGPHRLVLVTCAGAFEESTRSYRDNLVVIAEPAP